MSYTVKTPEVIALIERLNAQSEGVKYRVIKCTEWDNFQLQAMRAGERKYSHVFDGDYSDVISTVRGLLLSDEKVKDAAGIHKDLKNQVEKMYSDLADVNSALQPEYVVLHGGEIGLYISAYTHKVGGYDATKLFMNKDKAETVAASIRNGNNSAGVVMLATEAVQADYLKLIDIVQTIEKLNPWIVYM